MSEITDRQIELAIEHIVEFKEIQAEQKKRGLNDANTFTTLLSATDEVRVHSRFISFLLNPNANHYQDDLFLKEFLNQIKLEKFFSNTKNVLVYTEYKSIDIYLTDGDKHIILENKIWARDQKEQIERYIGIIQGENEQLQNEDLAVIYLTPTGWQLSEWSLKGNDEKGFYIASDFIVSTENDEIKYQYLQLSYKNNILAWLNKILYEIQNITNLFIMITQYKETVEKVLGKYEGKVMSLEKYIEDKNNKKDIIKGFEIILQKYPVYKKSIMEKFWNQVSDEIQTKIGEEWLCEFYSLSHLETGKKCGGSPFRVYQKEYNDKGAFLGFEYWYDNYESLFLGICLHGEFNTLALKELLSIEGITSWWIEEKSYLKIVNDKNLYEFIIDNGIDESTKKLVEEFWNYFNKNKGIVEKINSNLDTVKNNY